MSCPNFVRGARLAMRDVDGGVAFTITAPRTGDVAPLRELLRELASLIELHAGQPQADIPELPPLDIAVRDIAAGALVTVTAQQTANIPVVRIHARTIEKLWHGSKCINRKPPPGKAPTLRARATTHTRA